MNQSNDASRILRQLYPQVDSDDPVSYFSEAGNALEALKYGWLYWPNLVEIHGAVFLALAGNDEVDIESRLNMPVAEGHLEWSAMSWAQVVNSYNIFEVQHLFQQWTGSNEFSEDIHRQLAGFLVSTWQARLLAGYPQRRFVVRAVDPDDSMDFRIEVLQEWPVLEPPPGWDSRRRGLVI